MQGDWGDIPVEDAAENEYSIKHGLGVISSYAVSTGERVWVITEHNRSHMTLLLPSEY